MPVVRSNGKYSKALCDRCGWKCRYTDLREERTSGAKFMVCRSCYDPIPYVLHGWQPTVKHGLEWTRPEFDILGDDNGDV